MGGLPIWATVDELYWWLQTEVNLAPTSIQLLYPRFEGATLMSMVMEFQNEEAVEAALRMMPYKYGYHRITTRRQNPPGAKKAAAAAKAGVPVPVRPPAKAAVPVAQPDVPPWRRQAVPPAPPPARAAREVPVAPAEPVRAAPAEPVEVAAAPAEAVEVAAAPAEAVEVAAELVEVAAADDYEEPAVPAAEAAPLSPPPADEHEEMDPWQRRFLRLNLQARLGQGAGDDANSDTRSSTAEQEVAETELPLPPNRDDTPTVSSVLSDEFTPRQEEEPEWLELESAMVRRAAQEFLGFLLGVYIFAFLLLVLPT